MRKHEIRVYWMSLFHKLIYFNINGIFSFPFQTFFISKYHYFNFILWGLHGLLTIINIFTNLNMAMVNWYLTFVVEDDLSMSSAPCCWFRMRCYDVFVQIGSHFIHLVILWVGQPFLRSRNCENTLIFICA